MSDNPFADDTNYEQENKNNMSYWFPLLCAIRMRVPKTILVHSSGIDLDSFVDYETPEGIDPFIERIQSAVKEVGLPCFIRTGMTSNKHGWKDSCYLEKSDREEILRHLQNLVEHSHMANIAGLPFDYSIIAIREMIPTKEIFKCFNDMPITKERRLFINNGEVVCNHPYWPLEAFESHKQLTNEQITELQELDDKDSKELTAMAKYIGKYLTGYWSVDFLQDVDGNWWCTDMAVGERSYHYPACENDGKVLTKQEKCCRSTKIGKKTV